LRSEGSLYSRALPTIPANRIDPSTRKNRGSQDDNEKSMTALRAGADDGGLSPIFLAFQFWIRIANLSQIRRPWTRVQFAQQAVIERVRL